MQKLFVEIKNSDTKYRVLVFVMKTAKTKQKIADSWIQVIALKLGEGVYLRAGLIFGVKNKLKNWCAYLQRT